MAVEQYREHFDPLLPPEEVHEAAEFMLQNCPVAHSDQAGGFWLVNRYRDVMKVLRDSTTFPVRDASGGDIPPRPVNRVTMPPININPPEHRGFREVMNPYLTPQVIDQWEAPIRAIVANLLDGFVRDGHCDFAAQFAKQLPPAVTFRFLFSTEDPDELARVRFWTTHLIYDLFREDPETLAQYQADWNGWMRELIALRRVAPRQSDILDALLNEQINGAQLTDLEVQGAMTVLTLGGFSTTADALCNLVISLAEEPGLEDRLRSQPALIPRAIEESLRLEPPVTAIPRKCTEDARLDDYTVTPGEGVLLNIVAANRDPSVFDRPADFDMDRSGNRHLAFGGGVHRCIGSNLARIDVRIAIEELLLRVKNIRIDGEVERVSAAAAVQRIVDVLPIGFEPIVAE